MKRLNERDAISSEFRDYSKNEKRMREYEVFTQLVKLRVNEVKERENKEIESYSNIWSQNLVEENQSLFREKFLKRENSSSFTSYFSDYFNNQSNNIQNPNKQKEYKVNEIQIDHIDQEESHHQLHSEFINNNNAAIHMEVDDSPISNENKEVSHIQEFSLNNVSELININEVKAVISPKKCVTPNCKKPYYARGYCLSCYRKYNRLEKKKRICNGCRLLKPHHAKGYCYPCYSKYVHEEKKIECIGCGLLKPNSAKGYCKSCNAKNVYKKNKKECNRCGLLKPHSAKGNCECCYWKNVEVEENKKNCNRCGLLKPHKAKGFCKYCYKKNARLEKNIKS